MKKLLMLVLLVSLTSGCADVGRQALLLSGCEAQAMDQGYCHLPKEVKP